MRLEQMMKHAEQMHEHLHQDLAATEVEATAGGGMVTVAMNGLSRCAQSRSIPRSSPRTTWSYCRTWSSPPSTTRTARSTKKSARRRGRCWADRRHPESAPRALLQHAQPSTATAETDDPTIRRVIRFAAREDATEIAVINQFAARATDPTGAPCVRRPGGTAQRHRHRATSSRRRPHHRSVGSNTRRHSSRTSRGGPQHTHPARRRPPPGRPDGDRPPAPPALPVGQRGAGPACRVPPLTPKGLDDAPTTNRAPAEPTNRNVTSP